MLPTFVIGLREGLEAALIVSILATFLRRNGASLRGLWLGVGAGVALSLAVGVILDAVERSLPQAKQEAMETIIGLVAVFFVTGMVFWMRTHARFMKRDLEAAAAGALTSGTTAALALMAFLAVLREGFETAVFLLATFQSAGSAPSAVFGAVAGILAAVVLGWGMYRGGVRLNLQRFFSITGFFLILVAAGLVLNAFRTGHEAGWVSVGQGRTVDLTWLAPAGSIRSALFSGVLGIPRDPRVIEVLAWVAYLVPMLLITFLPARLRPGHGLAQRLRVAGAAVAVVAAVVLVLAVPTPKATLPATAPLQGGGEASIAIHGDTAVLAADGKSIELHGDGTSWSAAHSGARPSTLDITTLLTYTGNRVPVGLDVHSAPGPYQAAWADHTSVTATTYGDRLVDARTAGSLVLTLSGGGLTSPRVMTLDPASWQVDPAYAEKAGAAVAAAHATAHDRLLWTRWVPVALLATALLLLGQVVRTKRRASRRAQRASVTEGTTHVDSLT
ncbi:FTR1 family protein [Nocardioides sp. BP30]|uniref:iron uptake transporter permease EfeU n=1 Tax=Nocardioides sp. BP30 TaxID=3036374 RepID=UPI002468A799|nr:iron uptake transporter permease EfeU [Nocardioides sp. BP30]WGL53623.1 FTR1 family protein [Nocardioides sp. BP30]